METMTSPGHLAALAATVAATAALTLWARLRPHAAALVATLRLLAVVLVANELYYEVYEWQHGLFSVRYSLPLYLCDVAAFVAGFALWTRRALAVEITWFWALAGTLQGLLTPDSVLLPSDYVYWQFYIDHGGVVAAAVVLVAGLRVQPRRGSILRIFAITLAFTVAAAAGDVITDGNYMYLRHVPASGSLLSVMGPWPWYIVSGMALALVFLVILDAPFWRSRRLAGHQAHQLAP